MQRILLLDDEPNVVSAIKRVLRAGFGPDLRVDDLFLSGAAAPNKITGGQHGQRKCANEGAAQHLFRGRGHPGACRELDRLDLILHALQVGL